MKSGYSYIEDLMKVSVHSSEDRRVVIHLTYKNFEVSVKNQDNTDL